MDYQIFIHTVTTENLYVWLLIWPECAVGTSASLTIHLSLPFCPTAVQKRRSHLSRVVSSLFKGNAVSLCRLGTKQLRTRGVCPVAHSPVSDESRTFWCSVLCASFVKTIMFIVFLIRVKFRIIVSLNRHFERYICLLFKYLVRVLDEGWVVWPYSLIEVWRCFRCVCCLHLQESTDLHPDSTANPEDFCLRNRNLRCVLILTNKIN